MINQYPIPVIIVSYRNPKDVAECLLALTQVADPAFDVFVCENGGSAAFDTLVSSLCAEGGSCERDQEPTYVHLPMPRFSRVQNLRLRDRDTRVVVAEALENFGYGGAINAWLRVLRALPAWPGAWVLNPDTQPEPHALAELVTAAAARRKGMVGSRVVHPERPGRVSTRGLRWRRGVATTKAIGRGELATVEPDPEQLEAHLMAPSGVSIYVTRRCLEYIGLMEEKYFLYFEDLEWGHRAKRSCGVGYAHKSIVLHKSSTTIGASTDRSKASALSVYLDFRNRVNFVRQCYPSWMVWTALILVARSLQYGMVGAFANMWVALRGLKAGLLGETGRPDRLFDFDGLTPGLRKTPKAQTGISHWVLLGSAVKRRAKIAISLVFYLMTEANCLIRWAIGRPASHRLVILYYHGLPANLRANFARQLDIIATHVKVVPADYHEAAAPGGRSVAITFDDAFESVLDNAIPALRARRMPTTIFIPVGKMGCMPTWEIEPGSEAGSEAIASADVLCRQISDLVHCGAHSLTHPHLTRVPREQACGEITGCRDQMSEMFGVDVRIFAFPYGEYNDEIVGLCRVAGYERVYTNIPRVVDPASGEFVRGRVLVKPDDGPLEFYLKMSGAYAWMAHASTVKRRLQELPRHIRGLFRASALLRQ
jgi:N-acetylglucosaminyl-diphospho-decaprenol L-rhamnosyltransferase